MPSIYRLAGPSRHSFAAIALVALFAVSCAHSRTGGDAPAAVAIVDVRVFDGTQLIPRTTVIVENGEIVAMAPDAVVPSHATVVFGDERTLLPGLIDSHTHVRDPGQLRQALAFGVTTELEMAGDPEVRAAVDRLAEAGGFELADLRSAGNPVTAPGGHGTEYGREIPTLDSAENADRFVEARIAEGSDFIKIMYDDGTPGYIEFPIISRDSLSASVQAAHDRGLLAIVHISSEDDALAAAQAGADGLAHIPFAGIWNPELVEVLKAREVFVTSTLAVFYAICDATHARALATDPRIARFMQPSELETIARGYTLPSERRPPCAQATQAARRLHESGVTLLAGTDTTNPGTAHGASLHDELASLVAAGMTPREALRAATVLPAQIFGLTDRGEIAVGKRADLLLVDGDPTTDITSTRNIAGVWTLGKRFDHAGYMSEIDGSGF